MMSTTRTFVRTTFASRLAFTSTVSRCQFATSTLRQDAQSHLPRVANPALWRGIVPKFLRRRQPEEDAMVDTPPTQIAVRERNPGLSLIILGLLAGSFAINVISLRREMANFTRKTETKLELLREVIQQVKNGEDVDVKRLLGTGDPQSEKEWMEVLNELETTDMITTRGLRRKEQVEQKAEARAQEQSLRRSSSLQANQKSGDQPKEDEDRSKPKFMM